MIWRLVAVLALMLIATPAFADEPRPWSASAAVGNEWIGGQRSTGGISITVGGRYDWQLGERVSLDAGLSVEAFGFAGGSHWMALIGGPSVGVSVAPAEWMRVGLDLSVPYGRVPTCNDWGLCIRYWGIYPGGALRTAFGGESFAAVADLTIRYIDTLGWRGASVGLTGGGVVRW